MKKLLALLLCLCSLCLNSCGSEHVNDSERGDILVGEKRYRYVDGSYSAFSDYFDADGNACALKLKIQGGVLAEVSFDYFDTKYTERSVLHDEARAEELAQYRTSRKSLAGLLLSDQTISSSSLYRSGVGSDFAALAVRALANAESGDAALCPVSFVRSYTAEAPLSVGQYELFAKLTLSYSADRVNRVSFDIVDAEGTSIRELDDAAASVFSASGLSAVSILAELSKLPEADLPLLRTDIPTGAEEIYSAFNTLVGRLAEKHRAVDAERIGLLER